MAFYRRHRTDSNHTAVKKAFHRLGWTVWDVSQSSQSGEPDLVVAKGGRVIVVEVKTVTGKLRETQTKWLDAWPAEFAIVRTVDEVIALNVMASEDGSEVRW